MEYTVNGLARLAGVSVRTLHWYDEIGLLRPARVTEAGYRMYGPAEVDALQSILLYRALDVPLKKIGALSAGSRLASHDGEEVAHMLFGDGVGYSAWFATHPPLVKRIQVMEPQFDPAEFDAIARAWANPVPVGDADGAQVSISGFAPAPIASAMAAAAPAVPAAEAVLPQADAQIALSAQKVVKQVAHPGNDDYQTAGAIHTTISEKLRALAYMGTRCQQVVYALALDTDATMRGKQLALLEKRFDANVRKGVEEIAAETDGLHPMQRLPLDGWGPTPHERVKTRERKKEE